MRLLLTTDTIGGVWTFTHTLTAGLLKRGHQVALVSFGRTLGDAHSADVARLQAAHQHTFLFHADDTTPLEWMPQNGRAYTGGAATLARFVQATGFVPDVVHSSQFCFGAFRCGAPVLVTAHSDVLSWAAACEPAELAPSAWLTTYRELVQAGLEHAAALAAPTAWMALTLRDTYSLGRPVEVIPNGADQPPCIAAAGRQLQAVTAGRLWDKAKGLDLLPCAPLPLPMLVAGDTQLASLASVSVPSGCKLLGAMRRDELLHVFGSSAIYLALSRYEPFGLAPLEAAMCGCAVIARDIASLREVWADGALYVTTSGELRTLLTRLVARPEELAAAQGRSRARARHFSADRMVEGYLATYKRVATIADARKEPLAHAI